MVRLDRPGFVVMKRPPEMGGAALGRGFGGSTLNGGRRNLARQVSRRKADEFTVYTGLRLGLKTIGFKAHRRKTSRWRRVRRPQIESHLRRELPGVVIEPWEYELDNPAPNDPDKALNVTGAVVTTMQT